VDLVVFHLRVNARVQHAHRQLHGSVVVKCLHLGLGHANVIEVNFGADSPDSHYANMRAYMWGKMKEWLLTGAIDADPRLEADLAGPGYFLDGKIRVRLESKDDVKKRGLDSPDDGDALALTFARTVAARQTVELGFVPHFPVNSAAPWME
jgi:hypothetical protein